MGESAQKHPAHVSFAIMAITFMALGLAAGLDFLGLMERLNRWILSIVQKSNLSSPANTLSSHTIWIFTALMSLCLAAAMLNVSGQWRRVLIWMLTVIITIFWVPVLWLASYKPDIGITLVSLVWSGCCALVYCMNHEMPADMTENE